MIRFTAKVAIKGVARAYLEELTGCNVDGNDRTDAVVSLEVDREAIAMHNEQGAIKEALEDDTDIRVMSVQILDAQCTECNSQAPHRCECVAAGDWTDDQEAA